MRSFLRDFEAGLTSAHMSCLIQRFGHGDCHDLVCVLTSPGEPLESLKVIEFVSEKNKIPVHSAIQIDDEYVLDAHGVSKLVEVRTKYQNLSQTELSEDIVVNVVPSHVFTQKHAFAFDEDMFVDTKHEVDFLLQSLMNIDYRNLIA